MSPSKFQDSDVTKGVINGPRPLPLRISKDSHLIHKPPPPPNPSSHQPATDAAAAAAKNIGQSAAKRQQPVIIYTHSPKVIHTNARDFMALVQSLTGLSRADGEGGDRAAAKSEGMKEEDSNYSDEKDCSVNNLGYVENNETTSVLTDDQRFIGDVKQDSTAVSAMYKMSNAFLVDAPLFTPNSNEFFCSSTSRPNSLFPTTNMAASSISPSFMDYMKAFPDY